MDKLTNVIDLRAGSAASTFGQYSPLNRHILIGRMNHLEKMGLAQPTDRGRWQLDKDAFKTLGQIEQREQLNKDIHAALWSERELSALSA